MEEKDFYHGWDFKCDTPQGRTYLVISAYNSQTKETVPVDIKSSCSRKCNGCLNQAKTKIKDYLISPINYVPEINQPKPNELEESVAQP